MINFDPDIGYKNKPTIYNMPRMSGAYSKPMPWAGGGATKPPMANNYLDSHGLNAGLNCKSIYEIIL